MVSQSNDKQDLWKSRIAQYRDSGLSAKEWCKKYQVSYHAIKYWITKLNKKSTNKSKGSEPVFVAVSSKTVNTKSPIVIHFGEVSIEILDNCSENLLSNLMGVLKNYA